MQMVIETLIDCNTEKFDQVQIIRDTKVNKNTSEFKIKLDSHSGSNLVLKEVFSTDRLTNCKQNSFKCFLV